jgi:dTDP-4-dehydrorhamnose reductase
MPAADAILVLGHTGLLGRAVVEALGPGCLVLEGERGQRDLAAAAPPPPPPEKPPPAYRAAASLQWLVDSAPTYHRDLARAHAGLDLMRRAILELRPRLVINCAGYTAVDRAEAEPKLAQAVNAAGAGRVAEACARAGSALVHVSTDFVFDGKGRRPYRETDQPAPLGAYGRSKLEGERLVLAALPSALVVRTAWLFGPGRPDFVDKVVERAKSGGELRVVWDQVGSPTYTRDMARELLALADKGVGGVVHVVNSGRASRLELARRALELIGLDPETARPAETAELGLAASRPAYSVLDTRRLARLTGGPPPSWLDALRRHLGGEGAGP